jgi:putative metallohydrolase (TIGR04338 family)
VSRPRDSQRAKLYRAENALDWPGERRWGTVPEIQRYVDRLVASVWFKRRWPQVNERYFMPWSTMLIERFPAIEVADGRGGHNARAHQHRIQIPTRARQEHVVLHELAHCLTWNDGAAHGWEFAAVLVALVQHQMGKPKADALKASFRAHKVRYTKPRPKRVLSEAEKQALRDRLDAMRRTAAADKEVT